MSKLPIVFAPGLMCDHRLFDEQAAALGEERAISVADFSQDDAIDGMATQLLAGAPDQFYLAGLSMGGIVAFEVWRQAPTRVAGLALLNTTPFADSPARRSTRLSQIERVAEGALKTVVMEELKPNYLGAQTKNDPALLNEIYSMADRLGPEVFERQSRALMTRGDSATTLATINCPTLIIAGDEDEVCPPELHEIMHQGVAGSTYRVVAECGHLSTMEAPDRVTDLLRRHLTDIEKDERDDESQR
ncbi:MAG: alpha/beta fold hydrolase [Pseudomonadota bacterium]